MRSTIPICLFLIYVHLISNIFLVFKYIVYCWGGKFEEGQRFITPICWGKLASLLRIELLAKICYLTTRQTTVNEKIKQTNWMGWPASEKLLTLETTWSGIVDALS